MIEPQSMQLGESALTLKLTLVLAPRDAVIAARADLAPLPLPFPFPLACPFARQHRQRAALMAMALKCPLFPYQLTSPGSAAGAGSLLRRP